MKKFVFVYYGGGGAPEGKTMDDVVADWGKWFEQLGSALADGGNPFNSNGSAVTKGGVETIAADNFPATGYTIVNAEDMEAATEMAKGCPALEHNDDAAVRVYEAMPM